MAKQKVHEEETGLPGASSGRVGKSSHTGERIRLSFEGETTLTKRSFKDACDINAIMSRWKAGSEPTHLNGSTPRYGDFTSATDYQDASNKVLEAQAAFAALPSVIRDRMDNNPAILLEFLADEENLEEGLELGLLERPEGYEPEAATPAPVEPEPPRETGAEKPQD